MLVFVDEVAAYCMIDDQSASLGSAGKAMALKDMKTLGRGPWGHGLATDVLDRWTMTNYSFGQNVRGVQGTFPPQDT